MSTALVTDAGGVIIDGATCAKCGRGGFRSRRAASVHEFWCGKVRSAWNTGLRGAQVPWNKAEGVEITCICGRQFRVVQSRSKTAKYCSFSCKQKYQLLGEGNPAKLPQSRAKISRAMRGRLVPWIEGKPLPEPTRQKISDAAKARWHSDSWAASMIIRLHPGRRRVESPQHANLKERAANVLKRLGYVVALEEGVKLQSKWYVIDVLARRGSSDEVLIECGSCARSKLVHLAAAYEKVVHLPFGANVEEVLCGSL